MSPHKNLFRLMFAQAEIVTAHFDFDGVAERGKANELHGRADEQSHFEKASAVSRRNFDLSNDGGVADLQ